VLAILSRGAGTAAAVLDRSGVDRPHVKRTILEIVRKGETSAPSERARPYTFRTQNAFALARESALGMGSKHVAAEHLLMGVLREGMNIGAQVLRQHGLTPESAAEAIRSLGTENGS
jgi:ATP-dependent Clp protease ATP-binding subunit ClpA